MKSKLQILVAGLLLLLAPMARAELPATGQGTITLQGRPYSIDVAQIPANTHWVGVPGTILNLTNVNHDTTGKDPDWWGLRIISDNTSIEGCEIHDATIKIDRPAGGMNQNVTFQRNKFINADWRATGGLQNFTTQYNTYTGTTKTGFGQYLDCAVINFIDGYNAFIDIGAGEHLWIEAGSSNILVEGQYYSGIRGGMGSEIGTPKGGVTTIRVRDCWWENPNQGTAAYSALLNWMPYSLVFPGSTDIIVERLVYVDNSKSKGWVPVKIGFETAGIGYVLQDCIGIGGEFWATDADGTVPSSDTIRNCWTTGAINGTTVRQDWHKGGTLLVQNVGNSSSSVSSLMQWRYAKNDKPSPTHLVNLTIPVNPNPTTLPAEFSFNVALGSNTTDPSATFSAPQNIPTGAVSFRLDSQATMDHTITTGAGPTGAIFSGFPFTADLYHPGWQVDSMITALNSVGQEIGNTGWITLPKFPGLSTTTPWPPVIAPPASQPTTAPATLPTTSPSGFDGTWHFDLKTQRLTVAP